MSCFSFTTNTSCSNCPSFYFKNNSCLSCERANISDCSLCAARQYIFDPYNNVCFSCPRTIDIYQCSLCPGYSFINQASCSLCLNITNSNDCQQCPNYFFDSVSTRCLSCKNISIATAEACYSCGFSWSSTDNVCFLNSSCEIPYCQTCSDNGGCEVCFMGFSPVQGTCLKATCQIANCSICAGSSLCYACYPRYQITSRGAACSPMLCNITNCALCSNANTCSACDDGYTLQNGQCVSPCNSMYCQTCSSANKCSQCYSSLALVG